LPTLYIGGEQHVTAWAMAMPAVGVNNVRVPPAQRG